jgi:hypothetical protein
MKKNSIEKSVVLLLVTFACGLSFSASAASLTYTAPTSILLSSPATTLTIASGSFADSLIVNATSVLVTLSSSTGGTFTLSSPSYDLAISSSSIGGLASLSCTAGTQSITLTQSTGQTIYTIAPAGTTCLASVNSSSNNSGGGGVSVGVASSYATSGGGGGGGGSVTPLPPTPAASSSLVTTSSTTSISSSTSTSSLEAELNALLAELAALEAQANGSGSVPSASSSFSYTFTRNLSYGMTGNDVQQLQQFLVSQASGTAATKLQQHGTTKTFGTLTLNALIEFQKSAGIMPASGYFGPITRAWVNARE